MSPSRATTLLASTSSLVGLSFSVAVKLPILSNSISANERKHSSAIRSRCSHCQKFAPEWDKIVEKVDDTAQLLVT